MKLLFDAPCAGTFKGSRAEIEKRYAAICVGHHPDLRADMDDPAIMEYARKNDLVVVTKDADFVTMCCDNDVRVAVLRGNVIYLIEKAFKIIGKHSEKSFFSSDP